MQILTDDGAFGFIIRTGSSDLDARFFGFQLVIAGQVIGDNEPSIIGSAMQFLSDLPQVDDARLATPETDPHGVIAIALADNHLHDRVVFKHAESLDRWLIVAYRHQQFVTWLAEATDGPRTTAVASVGAGEYDELLDHVTRYWTHR